MEISWYGNPGFWAYGAAALAFAWLALRLVSRWQSGRKPAMLLATAMAAVAAAVASAALVMGACLMPGNTGTRHGRSTSAASVGKDR